MNSTSTFDILNNTLKIAMFCGSPNVWPEEEPSGNGVVWHGSAAWDFTNLKSRLGLEYEIQTDLPETRDNLYPPMLALIDGVADVSIDYWGVNYDRSKLVNFSYPQFYVDVGIISGTTKGIGHIDLVMGVYDDLTFWLLNLAVVAQILMLWVLHKKENRERSIFTCALYVFGNVLYQPPDRKIMPKQLSGKALMTLFTIYNLALNLMYMNIIISILVSGSQPPEINSLADLNREIYQDVRIIMKRQSYVPQLLRTSGMLDGFEHRIDYIDGQSGVDTINKAGNMSHVIVTSYSNFHSYLCQTNRASSMTVGRLEDFRKSRQGFSASTSNNPF